METKPKHHHKKDKFQKEVRKELKEIAEKSKHIRKHSSEIDQFMSENVNIIQKHSKKSIELSPDIPEEKAQKEIIELSPEFEGKGADKEHKKKPSHHKDPFKNVESRYLKDSKDSKDSSFSEEKNPPEGFHYDKKHRLCYNFLTKVVSTIKENKEKEKMVSTKKENKNTAIIQETSSTLEEAEADDNEAEYDIENLLELNKKFVEETLEKDPEYFVDISSPQHPKYLIISCSDSRIQTNHILGTHPGELFIHRNIGNLVNPSDFNFQSVLSYAIENLKVKHVMVIGHTDCGAIKASLSGKYHGLIDHWLLPIRNIAEKDYEILQKTVLEKGDEYLTTKLCELNIREQVLNLCKNPIVQKAWNKGSNLHIHGLLYDMKTGLLNNLEIFKRDWKEMKHMHTFDFHEKVKNKENKENKEDREDKENKKIA